MQGAGQVVWLSYSGVVRLPQPSSPDGTHRRVGDRAAARRLQSAQFCSRAFLSQPHASAHGLRGCESAERSWENSCLKQMLIQCLTVLGPEGNANGRGNQGGGGAAAGLGRGQCSVGNQAKVGNHGPRALKASGSDNMIKLSNYVALCTATPVLKIGVLELL